MSKYNIGVIGIGKLGLAFSLLMESAGHTIYGVDRDKDYIDSLKTKNFDSQEPGVSEMLQKSTNFFPTTDITNLSICEVVFIFVDTPSLPSGKYDHSNVDAILSSIKELGYSEKVIVIGCTVMPGYTETVCEQLPDCKIVYNPEFIAQGSVIDDLKTADLLLFGARCPSHTNELQDIYASMMTTETKIFVLTPTEAEITKISINCFLTTKISFANLIGDIASSAGADADAILKCVGSDTRINNKYLKYGHGFGGPCLPRDNRALGIFAKELGIEPTIPKASDKQNIEHLMFLFSQYKEEYTRDTEIVFECVTYKKGIDILEESQVLALAKLLADDGYQVKIIEQASVIEKLKKEYGNLFKYECDNE